MKLVIIDRDGTINEDRDDYVKSVDEWVPIPGSLEAIARREGERGLALLWRFAEAPRGQAFERWTGHAAVPFSMQS